MTVRPIPQSIIDNRDRSLTIGFTPDTRVRNGDIIQVVKGRKYPIGSVFVVKYAIVLPHRYENGVYRNDLFILCRGGELVPASSCVICSMANSNITHYPAFPDEYTYGRYRYDYPFINMGKDHKKRRGYAK